MSINGNAIPAQTLLKVVKAQEEARPSLLNMLGTKHNVTSLSGEILTFGAEATLPRTDQGGVAPGATRKRLSMSPGTLSYSCKRYGGDAIIPDQHKIDLDAYEGYSTLEAFTWLAMQTSRAQQNEIVQAQLSSTSLNETGAAGTAWTDPSSTPLDNLDAAFNAIGDGDTVVLGRDVMQALQKHPDFVAEYVNFSAGGVGMSRVAATLQALYPWVNNVIVADRMYNSAGEGLDYSLGYQFNGLMWVGFAKGCHSFEQTGNIKAEQDRDVEARSTIISYEEVVDFKRSLKSLGYVITGVI